MAGNSAMQPVQAMIYSVLTGDVTLAALLTTAPGTVRIYDEVPPSYDNFPYLQLGTTSEIIDNTFSTTGRVVTQDVHVYSNARGWKESQAILEEVSRLLDETLLPNPSGWTTYRNEYSLGSEIREPDGIRHIHARYTVWVERAGH